MANTIQALRSRRCWIDGQLRPATIFIHNGKISEVFLGVMLDNIPNLLDLGDLVLMPGIIDAHVHINEPGRADWEGFETATLAAAAGGTTTLIDMPLNASPVTTTVPAFHAKLKASTGKLNVHCGFYAGVISADTTEIEELIENGVFGFKAFLVHSGIDEFPSVGEKELDIVMPLLAKQGIPLLAHCELLSDQATSDDLNKEPTNYQYYLQSRPKSWENEAVAMMIRLCRRHNCRTHIVHVSSAESLDLIRAAKAEGLPLTAETCPHYLFFDAESIPNANTLYKCAPPIREKSNNELLKQALLDGTLDFVATDHSPAPPSIKELETGNLAKAWGGIAGVQFLLPVAWTALRCVISLEQFIPLVTDNPARFLGIEKEKNIAVGADADFVIWSPEAEKEIKAEDILFKHKISPYIGKQLLGVVHHTFVQGVQVYDNQQITNKNAGKWLLKK